jgi:zinc protease
MFQLLYLRFTQPRADPVAFAALKSQMQGLLANRTASPDVVFNQTLNAAVTLDHPRRQSETPETVERWDLNKSLAFYKARFGDASHFTFVFVGSFTPEMLRPLVETYIASLPATHGTETWRDIGVRMARGVTEKTVRKGIAPKSEVAIVFSGPFPYDEQNILAMRAMTNVLGARLFDTIRQELGATYDISVEPDTQKLPRPEYMVRIFWTSDPARTPAVVQRVWDEIRFVRDTALSPDQVNRIRAALMRQFEQDSQNNGYLLNQIARHYEDGDPQGASVIVDLPQRIGRLTGDEIQGAARTYLDTANYVSVVLMPETP